MIRKHFRIKWLVLGLAVAALAAPAAQAKTLIQSSGGSVQAHQPIASEMSVQSSITPLQAEALRWEAMAKYYKDNQPGITSAGTAIVNQKHDAYPVPVTVTSTAGDGFNWSDAGIGAGVTFAALLILGTVIGLGLRQRSRGGLANA
jgi:hypothetical protein